MSAGFFVRCVRLFEDFFAVPLPFPDAFFARTYHPPKLSVSSRIPVSAACGNPMSSSGLTRNPTPPVREAAMQTEAFSPKYERRASQRALTEYFFFSLLYIFRIAFCSG
jgi:hypothetical protein